MSTQHVTTEITEYEIEVDDGQGEWRSLTVSFTATATLSYQPARLSGPPEDCYPEESEIDLESLVLDSCFEYDAEGDAVEITPDADLRKRIMDAIDMDLVYDRLWAEWDPEEGRGGD